MTAPNPDWPSVLVPMPVRFTFDPAGLMYFQLSGVPGAMDVRQNSDMYIGMARNLFLPHVPSLNTAPQLGERTPEAFTELPTLDAVAEDIARWLA